MSLETRPTLDGVTQEPSHDEAWRAIVENYGERAELPEGQFPVEQPVSFESWDDDVDEPFEPEPFDLSEIDAFIPPVPEKVRVEPDRLLAWCGVLGAPLAAVIAVVVVEVTPWRLPTWLGWMFIAAFLGGFGYLVATMPKEREDPYDDGARL